MRLSPVTHWFFSEIVACRSPGRLITKKMMLQYKNLINTGIAVTALLLFNPISFIEARGSFTICDEKESQGNCQEFDLSDYEQGVNHPFSFSPRSGYRDSENLEECTYIRFIDENGIILCTLSDAFGFVVRDAKFYSRDIAAFQWGQLRYCHRQNEPKSSSEKDGPNRQLFSDHKVQHRSQGNHEPARKSILAGGTSHRQ